MHIVLGIVSNLEMIESRWKEVLCKYLVISCKGLIRGHPGTHPLQTDTQGGLYSVLPLYCKSNHKSSANRWRWLICNKILCAKVDSASECLLTLAIRKDILLPYQVNGKAKFKKL